MAVHDRTRLIGRLRPYSHARAARMGIGARLLPGCARQQPKPLRGSGPGAACRQTPIALRAIAPWLRGLVAPEAKTRPDRRVDGVVLGMLRCRKVNANGMNEVHWREGRT